MILVFGKTGQVAKELQKLEGIISLDRKKANLIEPMACHAAIAEYRPDAVINAAAYTAVDLAEREEELATTINSDAPGEMARACAKFDIPFIHISTDYVFDGSGEIAWRTYDKTNPQNAYGRSKAKGERAVIASGCVYVILRTSWVVSGHGENFVKTMLNLSTIKNCINVVDDQSGGPTLAQDIAKACVSIAHQLITSPEKSGIYHFSGAPTVSWYEFAKEIFTQARKKTLVTPIQTSEYLTPAQRPLNSRLDCSSLVKVFGIQQPLWTDGLADVLEELEATNEMS